MKTTALINLPNTRILAILLLSSTLGFRGPLLRAQTFESGSDGSYGAMNILSNTTLNLPPDGKFHCTTINIASNAVLRFNRNALNTPAYLLAKSNITIHGAIAVVGNSATNYLGGVGGPGGFDGGNGAVSLNMAGAGQGPGGGRPGPDFSGNNGAGFGAYRTSSTVGSKPTDGLPYGSPLLVPLVGGSGGGGMTSGELMGGGGGGGAILLASNTRIDFGPPNCNCGITAQGGGVINGRYNAGSGGGIRVIAPIVSGYAALIVSVSENNNAGGMGRVRIDTLDASNLSFAVETIAGGYSLGALMAVDPTVMPRLDIISAAGNQIPLGHPIPVTILLPQGASSNQVIAVRAQDFGKNVPINVVLTPEQGNPTIYPIAINNLAANPATNVVNVVVPVNVLVRVNAWTQ